MRQTLKKSEILRGRKNFQLLFEQGRKFEGKCLRCLFVRDLHQQEGDGPKVKFAVAISRSIRRAVDRNRIKRLVRESYRKHKEVVLDAAASCPKPVALVFLYANPHRKGDALKLPSYQEIDQDVQELLRMIVRKEFS